MSIRRPVQGNSGPYKPVPPPKPLPEGPNISGSQNNFDQMGYNRQGDNRPQSGVMYPVSDGQVSSHMNRILVTDQGHFHTHSAKFPFNCSDGRPGQSMYRGSGRFEGEVLDNTYLITNGECIGKSPANYAAMRYEPVGQNGISYKEHLMHGHQQTFRSQEAYQNNTPNLIQGNGCDTHGQIQYDSNQGHPNHIPQENQTIMCNQRKYPIQIDRSRDCISSANAQADALSQLTIGQTHNGNREVIHNYQSPQQVPDNASNHQQMNGHIDQETKTDKKKVVKKYSKLSNLISKFSKSENKNAHNLRNNSQNSTPPAGILINGPSYGRENNSQFKDKSLNASFRKAISYSTLPDADQNAESQNMKDRQKKDPRVHKSAITVYNPEEVKIFEDNRNNRLTRDVSNVEARSTTTGSYSHIANRRIMGQSRSHWDLTNQASMDEVLPSDHAYPELSVGGVKRGDIIRNSQASGGSDSGRGTGSSEIRDGKSHDTSLESGQSSRHHIHGQSSGNESEWIDITEPELQNLNEIMQMHKRNGTNTPTLPPLSPEILPKVKSNNRSRPQSQSFNSKNEQRPDLLATTNKEKKSAPQKQLQVNKSPRQSVPTTQKDNFQRSSSLLPSCPQDWSVKRIQGQSRQQRNEKSPSKKDHVSLNYKEQINRFEKVEDDLVSETIPDINSVIDGFTEFTTDDDDATSFGEGEAYLIRKQLDGLEGMYSEVLKLLGTRKNQFRRRMHGSMSSLPSSVVSARPIKDRKSRNVDDRIRKTSREQAKNPHKRFQRLESHVVTLARSVAHLSSEMRTQQLMFQEMEAIRTELGSLRAATVGNVGIKHTPTGVVHPTNLWDNLKHSNNPGLSNPGRVRKLTQFFGDEPPLVRLFLKKLGYEKYADLFEQERIGMLELPYLTEERLQKIGLPLGPRIRILQEAQGPIKCEGNLSVYVV